MNKFLLTFLGKSKLNLAVSEIRYKTVCAKETAFKGWSALAGTVCIYKYMYSPNIYPGEIKHAGIIVVLG